jgi:Lon protease-like protein
MSTSPSSELPLFPLGTVLFPAAPLPLHIFEERYKRLMADRIDHDPIFGVVLTKLGSEVGDEPSTFCVGTSASLLNLHARANGCFDLAIVGRRRFRILSSDWRRGYLTARIEWLAEVTSGATRDQLYDLRREAIAAFGLFVRTVAAKIEAEVPEELFPDDPTETSFAIAARLPINTWERQALLELHSPSDRLRSLTETLNRERAMLTKTGAAGSVIEHPTRRFSAN